jgi:hypothetical protein
MGDLYLKLHCDPFYFNLLLLEHNLGYKKKRRRIKHEILQFAQVHSTTAASHKYINIITILARC